MIEVTRVRETEELPAKTSNWVHGSGSAAKIVYGENTQTTRKRIRRLWATGELPYIKVGSVFLTKKEYLTEWVMSKEREMARAAATINAAK